MKLVLDAFVMRRSWVRIPFSAPPSPPFNQEHQRDKCPNSSITRNWRLLPNCAKICHSQQETVAQTWHSKWSYLNELHIREAPPVASLCRDMIYALAGPPPQRRDPNVVNDEGIPVRDVTIANGRDDILELLDRALNGTLEEEDPRETPNTILRATQGSCSQS